MSLLSHGLIMIPSLNLIHLHLISSHLSQGLFFLIPEPIPCVITWANRAWHMRLASDTNKTCIALTKHSEKNHPSRLNLFLPLPLYRFSSLQEGLRVPPPPKSHLDPIQKGSCITPGQTRTTTWQVSKRSLFPLSRPRIQ